MKDKFISIPKTMEDIDKMTTLSRDVIIKKLDMFCTDSVDKESFLRAIGCEQDVINYFLGTKEEDI